MTRALLLALVSAAAVLAGFMAGPADATPSLPPPSAPPAFGAAASYLMDLHLHGSLSERQGTMANHTLEAERAGYDGLWWTDHVERTMARYFSHRVRFEGSLDGEALSGWSTPNGWFEFDDGGGYASRSFSRRQAPEGAQCLKLDLAAGSSADWRTSRLDYHSFRDTHFVSLLAQPRLRVQQRVTQINGQAGAYWRVEFSSAPDGSTREGIPHALEYVASGSVLPAPPPNTQRITLPPSSGNSWASLDLDLQGDTVGRWNVDLGLRGISLVLVARSGGSCKVELDDFHPELTGPTDAALFRLQETQLRNVASRRIFHRVGMEIGEPEYLAYTSPDEHGDHLTACLPGPIMDLPNFVLTNPLAAQYPQSGVDWIQERGGVAILAHVFGTTLPPHEIPTSEADAMAARVRAARAWGADAIEVGYVMRGRPLAEHVKVWDDLSADRVYVTGVGVSDNHWVRPWQQLENRFGSWLRANSDSAADLCAAIRAGDVFFGDPFAFDPDGDFLLDEAGGAWQMGDVVARDAGPVNLRVRVSGARAGWLIRVVQNGVTASVSAPLAGADAQYAFTAQAVPGDWIRAELRMGDGKPVLFSNPVYFVAPGDPVPQHRHP